MTTRSKICKANKATKVCKANKATKVCKATKATKVCKATKATKTYTNSKTSSDPMAKKAPKKYKRAISKKPTKKDMEAAHILVELFHAPPAPPTLERTMSHTAEAEEQASPFFDQCQEGETILANYFIDQGGMGHVDYYTRENGVIVMKHIRVQETVLRAMPWTYETTPFKL
jgi:hypothetical protein